MNSSSTSFQPLNGGVQAPPEMAAPRIARRALILCLLATFANSARADDRAANAVYSPMADAAAAEQIVHLNMDPWLREAETKPELAVRIEQARSYLYSLSAAGVPSARIAQWTEALQRDEVIIGMPEQLVRIFWDKPARTSSYRTPDGIFLDWVYQPATGHGFTVSMLNHAVTNVH